MDRMLVSKKSAICNKISTSGREWMFQKKMKSFKDCEQTTVKIF